MPAGDITLTTPASMAVLELAEIAIFASPGGAPNRLRIIYRERRTGVTHPVEIFAGSPNDRCEGFTYDGTTGTFTDGVVTSILGELNKLVGVLFKAGARTTLTQDLQADGVITAPGTVA